MVLLIAMALSALYGFLAPRLGAPVWTIFVVAASLGFLAAMVGVRR